MDYNLYRQLVCDYNSSSKQGRNIACCESYGKLKQHIKNDGLNIPDTFCSTWGAKAPRTTGPDELGESGEVFGNPLQSWDFHQK